MPLDDFELDVRLGEPLTSFAGRETPSTPWPVIDPTSIGSYVLAGAPAGPETGEPSALDTVSRLTTIRPTQGVPTSRLR
ncbi:hypothetical protein [Kutzneria sp. NPDC052558]|uniref:hypothetical protein n=1 Tax=Kutzneria sp. NPDC052558 TaxID=3364121 RepID=UPI0037C92F9A